MSKGTPLILTPERAKTIIQQVGAAGGNVSEAARRAGIGCATYRAHWLKAKRVVEEGEQKAAESPPVRQEWRESGDDSAKCLYSVSDRVRTVEDALRKGNVDEAIWEVERFTVNSWEVAMKQDDGSALTSPLWQVKVWLRRKVAKRVADAVALICKRMDRHSPKYAKAAPAKVKGNHLLEVSIFDAHFGKLAWGKETGGPDYDLKIASKIYLNAVEELLAKAGGFPIERIVFPVGNDFFNIDGALNQTTGGTPQATDGRYPKIFAAGCDAVVKAIDRMRTVAPVEMLLVPGNHDRTTSLHLAFVLRAHYRLDDRVTIDCEPRPRKYIGYGRSLIGFTHGNEEKHASLPAIMAAEVPELWLAAKATREIHLGHFHKRKQTHYAGADTYEGVVVRVMPALSATDAWHSLKGYVNPVRAADAYLYHRENGYAGHLTANVR